MSTSTSSTSAFSGSSRPPESSTPTPGPDAAPRPTLFFCCAPEDRAYRKTLKNHLSEFFRERYAPWSEDDVPAGAEREAVIAAALERATVIVLLVSSDLLASTRHYEKEMKRALDRHEHGEALVIPVLLRACAWERAPFAKLQALPRETGSRATRVPVLSAPIIDEAFTEVAVEIQKAAETFVPVPGPPAAAPVHGSVPPMPPPSSISTRKELRAPHGTPTQATSSTRRILVLGTAVIVVASIAVWHSGTSAGPPTSSAPPTATATSPPISSSTAAPVPPPSASLASSSVAPPRSTGSATPTPTVSVVSAPSSSGSASSSEPAPSAATVTTATSGSASCKGTVCTLRANGALVIGSHFCLSAPASAEVLEDLKPTCAGKQTTAGGDITCVRADQAASIVLKGFITWRVCR